MYDRLSRRQRNHRRTVIRYYVKLAAEGILLIGAVFLMICGGRYLWGRFGLGDAEDVQAEEIGREGPGSGETEFFETGKGDGDREDVPGPYVGYTVVLDPGHGGMDSGSSVTLDGELVEEKNVTLAICQRIRELLEQQGVTVLMTRETDVEVSLEERAELSNREEADFFLSIHCNSFEDDASVSGLECFYWKRDDEGKEYAESIRDAVTEIEDLKVRGVSEGNYQVLRDNQRPAVLVETGFLTNQEECGNLLSEKYQGELAEKIVQGVLELAEQKLKGV